MDHSRFLPHGAAFTHGVQGRATAVQGLKTPDSGVRCGYTDSSANADFLSTNLLTAVLSSLTIVKIFPHLPHLGFTVMMVEIFPGNT